MLQGTEVKSLRDGPRPTSTRPMPRAGRRAVPGQRHDPGIPRRQPLQPRAAAPAQAAAAPARAGQADRRGAQAGPDRDPAVALLQSARPRQDRARPRPRQEELRQARHASRSATGSATSSACCATRAECRAPRSADGPAIAHREPAHGPEGSTAPRSPARSTGWPASMPTSRGRSRGSAIRSRACASRVLRRCCGSWSRSRSRPAPRRRSGARLEQACAPLVSAERFLALDDAALRAIGLSRRKMEYGRGLAEAVAGRLARPGGLADCPEEAAIATISALRGFGRWSAEIYLLFALGRTDSFPGDDLGGADRHAAPQGARGASRPQGAWTRWPSPGGPTVAAARCSCGTTMAPQRSTTARRLPGLASAGPGS